jgi:hypothetical protein
MMGARIGATTRHCTLAMAALLVACVSIAVAPAARASSTQTTLSLPAHYINNYGARAKSCSTLTSSPWVKWLSYADGTVSDEWLVYASSTKLCQKAKPTADTLIGDAPFNDGAGQKLDEMISYAQNHRNASSRRAPKPAGAKWKCTYLPSFWGEQASDLAHGSPPDGALAAASGAAAGAGFCEIGAKKSKGKFTGGGFFSWAPDTLSCKRNYTLKSIPDPSNPGETTEPPFPSQLWSDYDQVPC